MATFEFSDCVKFEPWVIETNFCKQEPRLLFVGESHYASRAEASNRRLTCGVVTRAKSGKLTKKTGLRFFTNIIALSQGEICSADRKSLWWPTVAFYNYIQVPVGSRSRTRLKLTMFADSDSAFHEVLEVLQPDIVIILGNRTWKHMSARDASKIEPLAIDSIDPQYRELWSYQTSDGKEALVFHVKHPSSGFNFRKFAPLLATAIDRYKSKR